MLFLLKLLLTRWHLLASGAIGLLTLGLLIVPQSRLAGLAVVAAGSGWLWYLWQHRRKSLAAAGASGPLPPHLYLLCSLALGLAAFPFSLALLGAPLSVVALLLALRGSSRARLAGSDLRLARFCLRTNGTLLALLVLWWLVFGERIAAALL